MNWTEARLKRGATPREFYDWLAERDLAERMHHFWDEPWWPDAYVVRLPAGDLSDCPFVDHTVDWDPTPDAEAYGDGWEWAQAFFEASSVLATNSSDRQHDQRLRLVHCFLNAHGLSQRGEAWFALRYFWNRATIGLRWRLYLRRRWEREQGPPVKASSE